MIIMGHKSNTVNELMAATTVLPEIVEITVETEHTKKHKIPIETNKATTNTKGGNIA